jgi:hypothetical protein
MQYTKYALLITLAVLCAGLVLVFSREASLHLNYVYLYVHGLFSDLCGQGIGDDLGRKSAFSLILPAVFVGWAIKRLRG